MHVCNEPCIPRNANIKHLMQNSSQVVAIEASRLSHFLRKVVATNAPNVEAAQQRLGRGWRFPGGSGGFRGSPWGGDYGRMGFGSPKQQIFEDLWDFFHTLGIEMDFTSPN